MKRKVVAVLIVLISFLFMIKGGDGCGDKKNSSELTEEIEDDNIEVLKDEVFGEEEAPGGDKTEPEEEAEAIGKDDISLEEAAASDEADTPPEVQEERSWEETSPPEDNDGVVEDSLEYDNDNNDTEEPNDYYPEDY